MSRAEPEVRAARRRRGRNVGSRLPRWLRPPRTLRPTRAGWAFFALTLGVGFGALSSGNNLLYLVFSLMLAFLVLSGVLSESALRSLEVRRRLPRELFSGAGCTLAVEIRNRSPWVPAFAIAVEDLLQPRKDVQSFTPLGRMFALRVGPSSTELRAYRLVPPQRGPLRLAGFRISTRFPFGLFAKATIVEAPETVLVYPGLDERASLHSLRLGAGEDRSERVRPGSGSDVVGLRPFVPGDSLRRVHWRATLRRGAPVVLQSEEPQGAEAAVYLATRGPAAGARFEHSVRRAAGQIVQLLAAGARVSLRTDAAWIPPDHGAQQRTRLLSFLARVAPEPELP